jgi:hypothetical protein
LPLLEQGTTRVQWLSGALWIGTPQGAVLFGAPGGIARSITVQHLRELRAVVFSSGSLRDCSGLIEIMGECARHRRCSDPLEVVHPLGDERIPAMLEAWQRGWPGQVDVALDAVHPGISIEVGPWIRVHAASVERGEPDWRSNLIRPVVALGWAISTPDLTICWARGAAPGPDLIRLCTGVDLAILEVGVQPWPRSDRRWRLRPDEAVSLTLASTHTWIVGDDGAFGVGDEN